MCLSKSKKYVQIFNTNLIAPKIEYAKNTEYSIIRWRKRIFAFCLSEANIWSDKSEKYTNTVTEVCEYEGIFEYEASKRHIRFKANQENLWKWRKTEVRKRILLVTKRAANDLELSTHKECGATSIRITRGRSRFRRLQMKSYAWSS